MPEDGQEVKHNSKYDDDVDPFYRYKVQIPDEYSEEEKQLQREFGILKQLKKSLLDLKSKLQKEKLKEEEKSKIVVKPNALAKEHAKKLLKSGAIKLTAGKESEAFKRKNKDSESGNLSDDEGLKSNTPVPAKKAKTGSLYDNFVKSASKMMSPAQQHIAARKHQQVANEASTDKTPVPRPSTAVTGEGEGITDTKKAQRKQQLVCLDDQPKTTPPVFVKQNRPPVFENTDLDAPRETRWEDEAAAARKDIRNWAPPSNLGGGGGGNTLHVKCFELTEELVVEVFSQYGTIVNINVRPSDRDPTNPIAFVTFEHPKHAAEACKEVHSQYFKGRMWTVFFAKKQPKNIGSQDQSLYRWNQYTQSRTQTPSSSSDRRPSYMNQEIGEGTGESKEKQESEYLQLSRDLISYDD